MLSPHITSVPTTMVTLTGLAGERADWWQRMGHETLLAEVTLGA